MIEYKIIRLNNSALHEMGKQNWNLTCIYDGLMYFSREVKRSYTINGEVTEQYLKFKELYPKKSGITDNKVINKINNLHKEKRFDELISGVNRYVNYLKVKNYTKDFILNPLTFLNQERWLDEFDIIEQKVGVSDLWINEHLKGLDPNIVKKVLDKKKEWQKNNPTKDFTVGVLLNIIDYFK